MATYICDATVVDSSRMAPSTVDSFDDTTRRRRVPRSFSPSSRSAKNIKADDLRALKPTLAELRCPYHGTLSSTRDCEYIEKEFVSQLKRHLSTQHSLVWCNRCWAVFNEEAELRQHTVGSRCEVICIHRGCPRFERHCLRAQCNTHATSAKQDQYDWLCNVAKSRASRPHRDQVASSRQKRSPKKSSKLEPYTFASDASSVQGAVSQQSSHRLSPCGTPRYGLSSETVLEEESGTPHSEEGLSSEMDQLLVMLFQLQDALRDGQGISTLTKQMFRTAREFILPERATSPSRSGQGLDMTRCMLEDIFRDVSSQISSENEHTAANVLRALQHLDIVQLGLPRTSLRRLPYKQQKAVLSSTHLDAEVFAPQQQLVAPFNQLTWNDLDSSHVSWSVANPDKPCLDLSTAPNEEPLLPSLTDPSESAWMPSDEPQHAMADDVESNLP